MEILTILRANIRHKKGSFTSIILLMLIISMSLTAILSVKENCRESIKEAHRIADSGDFFLFISGRRLTDELKSKVEEHPFVERSRVLSCVAGDRTVIGEEEYTNPLYMTTLQDNVRMIDEGMTGYEKEALPLKKGEIYVSRGLLTALKGKAGDKVTVETIGGEYELTIKGTVLEPVLGASVIGWKLAYINDEDFKAMQEAVRKAETEERTADIQFLTIYKSKDCTLTDAQFARQINLDTGIANQGFGSIIKDASVRYTGLFPEIISAILTAFIVLLLVVLLIVMGHSISTGIEMDYVNIGILKAQGFEKRTIRLIFLLQYVSAQLIGAVTGMFLAFFLIAPLDNVFEPIMAVVCENHASLSKGAAVIAGILLVSCLFLFLATKKVGEVSPVRAICGGRSEVYFDSRLKTPLSGKFLLPSLALRQFTSGRRRYVSAIVIAALLAFFMITMQILAGTVTSKSALEAMGSYYTEVELFFQRMPTDGELEEIEESVEEICTIDKKYYLHTEYVSMNGEEVMCRVERNPQVFYMTDGRAPLYDNEIVITDILAEELELAMGDEVEISRQDKSRTYLISGIFAETSDTGRCFGIGLDGAKKLGFGTIEFGGYSLLEDKREEVCDMLNEKYSGLLTAEANDGMLDESYDIAIWAMKAVVFSFSILFALVVVSMVCSKIYLQERTDIGIYKALGFTSGVLRVQFAVRFLIVALSGSAFGTIISFLFSKRLLSALLRDMGIANFEARFGVLAVFLPVAVLCTCFFLFAGLASGKVKTVEVKELVSE